MSVRSDVRQIAERLLPTNGQCLGVPVLMKVIREGDPIPEPPLCPLCDKCHWPAPEVQRICIVVIGKSLPRADECSPDAS
jgi:hypothetical protein